MKKNIFAVMITVVVSSMMLTGCTRTYTMKDSSGNEVCRFEEDTDSGEVTVWENVTEETYETETITYENVEVEEYS